MELRGRCGERQISPALRGARVDAEGAYIYGRDVIMGTGPDLHDRKIRRCPIALADAAMPAVDAWRLHADGLAPFTATTAAPLVEAAELAGRVNDRALAKRASEAD